MANQRLVYNLSGSNNEVATSGSLPSAYFDDTSNSLVAQGLVVNKITSSIGATTGILTTDTTGKLTSLSTASATNDQYLQSNGTSWAFRSAAGAATGNYLTGADLSGSLSAPIVTSIANVTNGILSAQNGGTGVSSFTSGGILIKDNTSTIKFLKPDAGSSILRPDGVGGWYSGGASNPTTPTFQGIFISSSMSPYTWAKPSGIKNAKIFLMAGGGGGGGGYAAPVRNGGGGGSAGAFSLYEVEVSSLTSAIVTIGTGGAGAIPTGPSAAGGLSGVGGDTSFSSSIAYFIVKGGDGGNTNGSGAGIINYGNLSKNTGQGQGGTGVSKNTLVAIGSGGGGVGGRATTSAGGIGADGNNINILGPTFAIGGNGGTAANNINSVGQPGSFAEISLGVPGFYARVGGGGGGGGGGVLTLTNPGWANGGNGVYGSGGGGGGGSTNGYPGTMALGGRGGDGYALIIYW